MLHRLLVVDDDPLHLESVRDFLESQGFRIDVAANGDEAIARIREFPHRYSLVLVDYRMAGKNGAATVEVLNQINPDLYTLILSADGSREAILQSTRLGARGFVDKSEGPEVILAEVRKWCRKFEQTHLTLNHILDERPTESRLSAHQLIGRSESLARIADQISVLKSRKGPVLILGESGTGKELVARALHDQGPFKAINCGAFAANPQLMASTLFGHKKGAFTGALNDAKGIFEEAKGGTVFLDEIYALPASCQVELLRALQENVVLPVGATREVPVSFRLVAAAKPDLLLGLETGTFKQDLFFRISRTILTLPPLRERTEDVAPLVEYFCSAWSKENQESKTFLARTLPFLESYAWPGNVRELQNVVYNLLDTVASPRIAPEHLDPRFFENTRRLQNIPTGPVSLKERMEQVEREHLASVITESKSLRESARKMKVSLTTVLRLMKKYQIDADALRGGRRYEP